MNFPELLKLKSLDSKDFKIHMAIGAKDRNEPWLELSGGNFKN